MRKDKGKESGERIIAIRNCTNFTVQYEKSYTDGSEREEDFNENGRRVGEVKPNEWKAIHTSRLVVGRRVNIKVRIMDGTKVLRDWMWIGETKYNKQHGHDLKGNWRKWEWCFFRNCRLWVEDDRISIRLGAKENRMLLNEYESLIIQSRQMELESEIEKARKKIEETTEKEVEKAAEREVEKAAEKEAKKAAKEDAGKAKKAAKKEAKKEAERIAKNEEQKKQANEYYASAKSAMVVRNIQEAVKNYQLAKDIYKVLSVQGDIDSEKRVEKIKERIKKLKKECEKSMDSKKEGQTNVSSSSTLFLKPVSTEKQDDLLSQQTGSGCKPS